MKLFHGSYITIPNPNLSFSRNTTDFGKGFYTTPIQTQAEKWAARFKRRQNSGVVSIYEMNDFELRKNESVLEFSSYSEEWLNYIVQCRQGLNTRDFSLVTGGIANDDVFNTLTIYLRGYIDKTEAIKRLRYEKPNIQYCFKNQKVIEKYLKYEGSIIL